MNILISGINGYIGSKLCRQLQSEKHIVHGLVRRKNTVSEKLGIYVYEADICEPLSILPQVEYDFFIHLAAANDIDSADSRKAYEVTALGTSNCLRFCTVNNIRAFIYFSTFQVYGELKGEFNEESPKTPNNDYGLTHLFAEECVKMFHRKSGLEYLILRPTNIYGAPLFADIDRWSLVPGCFCKEAVEKHSITLLSSGLQQRDFIDLDDLVQYCSKAVLNFEKIKNREINVSSGNIFSILEVAKQVLEMAGNELNKPVALQIKSNEPQEVPEFSISRKTSGIINHAFKNKNSLAMAVEQTLKLLLTQHA